MFLAANDIGSAYFAEAADHLQGLWIWMWLLLLPVLLALVIGAAVGALSLWVARPLRRTRAAGGHLPWHETARLAAPLRGFISTSVAVTPLLAALAGRILVWPMPGSLTLISSLGAFLMVRGVLLAIARRYEIWIRGVAIPRRVWRRDVWVQTLLFQPFGHLLLIGVVFVYNDQTWLSATALLVALLLWWGFAHRGLGVWVLRRLGLITAPCERLRQIAEQAQRDTGIEASGIFEIDWSPANAFMLYHSSEIGMSRGALELLDDDEARAVLCHELGHVADRREMGRGRALATWLTFPLVAAPLIVSKLGLPAFIVVYALALLVISRLQKAMRKWERRADDEAAKGSDPAVYAHALEKLYARSLIPAVGPKSASASHPDLFDRMTELGHPPDFPRPVPAASGSRMGLVVAVFFLAALIASIRLGGATWFAGEGVRGKVWLLPVAWGDGRWRARVIRAEALEMRERGDLEGAAALLRAVAISPGRDWQALADAASASLDAGQRDYATQFTEWAYSDYYYEVSKSDVPQAIADLRERLQD